MPLGTIALFLPSLDGGGAERAFVQLANEFSSLGFRVDIALATARGPYLAEISSGVRTVDFGASGVLSALPSFIRYLRTERPQVVLSALDHANIVAVFACFVSRYGGRRIVSARSVPTAVYRKTRSFRSWLVLQLTRVAYRFADEVIANSEVVAFDLAHHLHISESRSNVVYNPIDIAWVERMGRDNSAHPWCAAGDPPIILGVGSLTVLKDFSTLIRAFSIVRSLCDCHLVILGEGPERERLERLTADLRLQSDTYLPGFVKNPFPWMRKAKVFVSSSLTEGCPNALMQALASGTPIVSTDCEGSSAEILENGKWGRLVPVGEAAAMAEAILATFASTDHPEVRQRAKDFALNKIAQQYLEILFPERKPNVQEH